MKREFINAKWGIHMLLPSATGMISAITHNIGRDSSEVALVEVDTLEVRLEAAQASTGQQDRVQLKQLLREETLLRLSAQVGDTVGEPVQADLTVRQTGCQRVGQTDRLSDTDRQTYSLRH